MCVFVFLVCACGCYGMFAAKLCVMYDPHS